MKINRYFILFYATLFFASCSEDIISDVESTDAVELTGITASIEAGTNTRASGVVYLEDRISRYQFVSGDQMTFSKIERTEHPIQRFQYKDVAFNSNASGAWERDKSTGSSVATPSTHPERIYWSDATSAHTFVGYSLPKENSNFDWKKSAYTYDKDDNLQTFETYYGAIGNPLNSTEVIDFNPSTPTTETITTTVDGQEKSVTFGYSQKLRDEDLLLTFNDALTADNSVANIKFYHAMSSVRIIVNISGFYGTETDAYSKVSDMILKNQPTLYRWKQQNAAVEALLATSENATLQQSELWGNTNPPTYNQRKDMKLWNTNPDGDGQGASKLFTFYGITVPQGDDYFATFTADTYKNLELSFNVSYPDPLKNDPINKRIIKTYTAKIANPVKFYAGKCTTIKISLNHKDESMTVGASYQDWEYIESPDEGSLKKKTTFLSSAPSLDKRGNAGVTIAGDAKATADDATWLYNAAPEGETTPQIVDIYGNTGTADKPYTISTANQLLSFAYEVQNGRTFKDKYVKLDADITLQPQSALPSDNSKLVKWIGVGSEGHPFDGIFLGSGRHIKNLYGEHFFHTVGENAVIDKLNFDNVVEVQGCGVIAHKNQGVIYGCFIDGDVKETSSSSQYTGSIVGENDSFIIACAHVGKVSGYNTVGGLVGFNNGTVMACYHAGEIIGLGSDPKVHATVGKRGDGTEGTNNSIMFSCYYDNSLISHTPTLAPGKSGYPLSTSVMQSNAFVSSDNTYVYSESSLISKEGKTLRKILIEDFFDITDDSELTEQELITKLVREGSNIAPGVDMNFLFSYHFGLNKALQVFGYWLYAMPGDPETGIVHTNCRDFTSAQIEFLQQHYSDYNQFIYMPATYPKVQR